MDILCRKQQAVLCAVVLLCSMVLLSSPAAATEDSRVEELLELTASSPDGVIHLDKSGFSKFVDGSSRPYSLYLVCLAKHLMDKENLKLRQLRKTFGRASEVVRNALGDKQTAFFAEVEFSANQEVFQRLEVTMLPLILRIAPGQTVKPGGSAKPGPGDSMSSENFPHYPWSVADIIEFVSERSGLAIEVPPEPTIFQHPRFPLFAAGGLAGAALLAYALYHAPFMRWPGLYLMGTLAVYWFSVSGGMYNIIRGMPMVLHKDGGTQLFLQGQGQLGAEGFIMGSRYTGFGLALAAATLGAPRIRSQWGQRVVCYVCLAIAFMCLNGVIGVYKWKTGYGIQQYVF